MHPTARRKTPSPALVVALIALFVALGGPAQAAKLITGSQIKSSTLTGKHIKNRSLKTTDIATSSIRALQQTPANSVNSSSVRDAALSGLDLADRSVGNADLAPNSVGPGKILTNAVGATELADNSVDAAAVVDGALGGKDVARFADTFTADVPNVPSQACVGLTPDGLAPEAQNVDLSADVIIGTPPANWPDTLTFTIKRAPAAGNKLRIAACNPTATDVDPPSGLFRYAVLDLPS